MFNQLIETIRAFSYRTILRSNIISTPGGSFGQSQLNMSPGTALRNDNPSQALLNRQLLSSYYLKLQELKDYKSSELTRIILNLYTDYINNYFNTSDLIELHKDINIDGVEDKINAIFSQIDIVTKIKDNIEDYIYYGSFAFRCTWDNNNRVWKSENLYNPTSVISVFKDNPIPESYLVVSRDGNIFEVDPYSIIYFGKSNLNLLNDINEDYFSKDKDDTLISDRRLSGAIPLYYDNASRVKEYLLKEQMLSLLSIKDLVQPLLLLLRVDSNTAPDEANKLALNIENLINKYSDISSILGSNFSISELMDSLLNNIRVLPDNLSGMGDMNNIDLSKITNKIQEIRGDQENIKENLLMGLSIPRSLYAGDSTKWDAIKNSQRLNSRINNFVKSLDYSIRLTTVKFYKLLTSKDIDVKQVTSKLFKKTDADYNVELANSEIANNILDQVSRILDSAQRSIKDTLIADSEKYANWIRLKLISIDPELGQVVTDKDIKNYVNKISQERQNEQSGGMGSFGGY